MDYYDQPPSPPKDASGNTTNGKQQATFLTKLYALLERPENHHMIRWDADGEHIIVERPEQLALHVLPSIYRQSRFASFSRQLNIYGFMRKVNLRNVDPGINDPDASTWSHPSLNKHSPPEVVAAFKRRVPPRPAKPTRGKRPDDGLQPRSAITAPETMPFHQPASPRTRARGFSAPQPYNPPPPSVWSTSQQAYARAPLPPLTVPSDPPSLYNPSPIDDVTPQASSYYAQPVGGYSNGYGGYNAQPQDSNTYSSSISSLLNHGHSNSGYHHHSQQQQQRPQININTAYASVPLQPHSASSISPDSHSRPQTGYSNLAPYAEESPYGHHQRPHTPTGSSRPGSSRGAYASVRRDRRHSHTPYPAPAYEDDRGRGSIALPTVDYYPQSHDAFAYGGQNDWEASAPRHLRPSTSTSSLSTGSSAAHTPPNEIGGYADAADIHTRYDAEPFGYAVPEIRGYADPVKM